jgi:hypothetical protein
MPMTDMTTHYRSLRPQAAGVRQLGAAALAISALFAALPAAAVDGEILISQSRAASGGITPGDTAGFPVTISRSGSYKLSSNLSVTDATNAIEVTAADVTIDLNGFTIRSSPPGAASSGIVALTGGGVLRVSNGTIVGFPSAGIAKSPGFAVIEDMRIIGNGRNLDLAGDSQVRNSTIIMSTSDFGVFEPGIRCYARCLIENNVITGNIGAAVVSQGGGSTVIGNVMVGNGSPAVFSSGVATGIGLNILVENGSAGQVSGLVSQQHPNVCVPACP